MDLPWKGPCLYHLPDDVAETDDLLEKKAGEAKRLRGLWEAWNEHNVPCRLMPYKKYHKARDGFFKEAVPKKALDSGYEPPLVPSMP
ncbi:hypothetical protein [Roseibacillus persicicus]|uniref:Uncharacterized protein n=1 Tax=Roseibacillus persicicus TaxID=454148 RepID=A0A918TYC4_9BACT|nr:hypothetical protein [Roseibacillus persicicus]GHC67552.1 hypothetical protein GCM10007100_39560 [Roseibacillus persicicus]